MTWPSDPVIERLRAQVRGLHMPRQKALREKLTLLTVRCRNCGDRPFVVLMTEPYWVLCTRETDLDRETTPRPPVPEDIRAQGSVAVGRWRAMDRLGRSWRRRGEALTWVPLGTQREQDDAETETGSMCSCRSHTITQEWLWDQLDAARAGGPRVVTI